MKLLSDYIIESLIFEKIFDRYERHKIKYDYSKHSNDQCLYRDGKPIFITPMELAYTLSKAAKSIREDFDLGVIKEGDTIVIKDKSRDDKLNIPCAIYTKEDYIVLKLITAMNKIDFDEKIKDKKVYQVYISDKEMSKSFKPKQARITF